MVTDKKREGRVDFLSLCTFDYWIPKVLQFLCKSPEKTNHSKKIMAAAARQHTTKPHSVKEDAGRASKFSRCPSSFSSRLDSNGTPSGAASGPDPATLRVPDNQNLVTSEYSQWWLHSQHHIGNSGNAYTEYVKSDRDVRKEESGPVLNSNAQKPPNKNMGESWYFVDNLIVSEHDCLISEQHKTLYSDFDSQLVQAEKTEPWWHITDKDELASMVAQKSLESIENCDLPRPKTKDIRKGQLHSPASFGDYETLHSSLDWTIQTGFSDISNHRQERTTSISLDENQCMLGDAQNSLPNSDSLLSSNDFSTPKRDHGLSQTFPGNDPSTTQLLEALRYSQTRAREAEKAAEKAYDEKEHIITLFFRQASQLFAYKQWLRLLQLENFSLHLACKNQPISSFLPAELPWVPYKDTKMKKAEHKVVKQKKSSSKVGAGAGRSTAAVLVGLSLAGAGILLGWTMGWLLPST